MGPGTAATLSPFKGHTVSRRAGREGRPGSYRADRKWLWWFCRKFGVFFPLFFKINQPRSKRYQKLQLEVSQVSGRSSPVLWLRVIFGEIGVFSEIEAALGDQRHPGLGGG